MFDLRYSPEHQGCLYNSNGETLRLPNWLVHIISLNVTYYSYRSRKAIRRNSLRINEFVLTLTKGREGT